MSKFTTRLLLICLIFVCMLILCSCGSTPVKTQTEYVYVDRPVAINCIKNSPVRPFYTTETLPPTATDIEFTDALADDWKLSRVYEDKLEKEIQACIVPNK